MKAVFYLSLIVLALCVPEKYGAMWLAILIGVIIGNVKFNLKCNEK